MKIEIWAEPAVLVQAAQSPEQPAPKLAGSAQISILIRMILYFGIKFFTRHLMLRRIPNKNMVTLPALA